MKKLFFLLILTNANLLVAQYQIGIIPRESPDKRVYQKIGFTEIEIAYGSPSVKDRNVWGELEPYNVVWRAGANNATTIEVSTDIKIQDEILEAGKYAFFVIPKKDAAWTGIFSKKHKQWGSFKYDASDDALRIEMEPQKSPHQESLVYNIDSKGYYSGQVELKWEEISLGFDFEIDHSESFKNLIENRVAESENPNTAWIPYLQGAEYLVNTNTNLELAAEWINKCEASIKEVDEWNPRYYPLSYVEHHIEWTKAKILADQGDYVTALLYAESVLDQNEAYSYFSKKGEKERILERMFEWEKK